MRFMLGKFTAAVVVLVALISASTVCAQCLTCTNPFGGHCVTVSSGFGSCTDYPNSGDVTCKLACPNCPTEGCSGGGGGGECIVYTGDMGSAVSMGYTTATVGLIFKTDAATNAHLFGGRGQGYRVVPGSVLGDVDASAVRQTVQNLIGGGANLNVAFAFSNFNEAGIPIQFVSGGTEGFALAPSTNGMSSTIKFRIQNANKLDRALNQATLQSSDLLLIDIKARGQVYVMAINIQALNRSAGDFGSRIERIQELLRQTSAPYTGIDPMVFKMPDC
jgi:hypothetical protein